MTQPSAHRSGKRPRPARMRTAAALAVDFARAVAALRREREETQKQLAVRLGMTESMVSRLESGEHLPSLRTLCRIADAFDRRLEIAFHAHEHRHRDGLVHTHVHAGDDVGHTHDHPGNGT